jgi:hypothetical protein
MCGMHSAGPPRSHAAPLVRWYDAVPCRVLFAPADRAALVPSSPRERVFGSAHPLQRRITHSTCVYSGGLGSPSAGHRWLSRVSVTGRGGPVWYRVHAVLGRTSAEEARPPINRRTRIESTRLERGRVRCPRRVTPSALIDRHPAQRSVVRLTRTPCPPCHHPCGGVHDDGDDDAPHTITIDRTRRPHERHAANGRHATSRCAVAPDGDAQRRGPSKRIRSAESPYRRTSTRRAARCMDHGPTIEIHSPLATAQWGRAQRGRCARRTAASGNSTPIRRRHTSQESSEVDGQRDTVSRKCYLTACVVVM